VTIRPALVFLQELRGDLDKMEVMNEMEENWPEAGVDKASMGCS